MALAQKLGLTPEENETSRAIRAGGDKNLATLKTLSGAAFDKAYVDHEVVYHAQVLDAIDTTLIPGASNGELKALLACSVSVGTALFVLSARLSRIPSLSRGCSSRRRGSPSVLAIPSRG